MPIQSHFDSIGTYRIFVSGRLLSIGIGMNKNGQKVQQRGDALSLNGLPHHRKQEIDFDWQRIVGNSSPNSQACRNHSKLVDPLKPASTNHSFVISVEAKRLSDIQTSSPSSDKHCNLKEKKCREGRDIETNQHPTRRPTAETNCTEPSPQPASVHSDQSPLYRLENAPSNSIRTNPIEMASSLRTTASMAMRCTFSDVL